MRAKIMKITRFAADWIAPVGFFTVMCFVWIAACVVALVDQINEARMRTITLRVEDCDNIVIDELKDAYRRR